MGPEEEEEGGSHRGPLQSSLNSPFNPKVEGLLIETVYQKLLVLINAAPFHLKM